MIARAYAGGAVAANPAVLDVMSAEALTDPVAQATELLGVRLLAQEKRRLDHQRGGAVRARRRDDLCRCLRLSGILGGRIRVEPVAELEPRVPQSVRREETARRCGCAPS